MRDKPFAFPQYKTYGGDECNEGGMTLRDYFAAKAMQAMFASGFNLHSDRELVAQLAYASANAMLSEREKQR